MAKMRKLNFCKRGFLFTLGLTFLMLIILALAILIFNNAQKSEEVVAKLAVMDRIYDLDTSIQQSIGDIYDIKSGISINITNSGVTFGETLPNENMESLNDSIHLFKRFVESNLSNINMTVSNMGESPLVIMPQNIAYEHRNNWSHIEVLPTNINFEGYSIFINTEKNVSCNWNVDSGSFDLSLEVKGDAMNCDAETRQIDPSGSNEISVNGVGEGNIMIIKVADSGKLIINVTADTSMAVKTTVLINQPEVEIMAESIKLTFDFSDFGIYKEGDVRVI